MVRDLFGMTYKSVELEHDVIWSMDRILRELAYYFDSTELRHGTITSLTTQSHPDDEDKFLTTLVWSL